MEEVLELKRKMDDIIMPLFVKALKYVPEDESEGEVEDFSSKISPLTHINKFTREFCRDLFAFLDQEAKPNNPAKILDGHDLSLLLLPN